MARHMGREGFAGDGRCVKRQDLGTAGACALIARGLKVLFLSHERVLFS